MARRIAILNGFSVHEGFEYRTRLPPGGAHMIVLEILVTYTSHPRLHFTGLRVHRHDTRLQHSIIVAKRIHWTEERIALTFPGEYGHATLGVENNIYRVGVVGIALYKFPVTQQTRHLLLDKVSDFVPSVIDPWFSFTVTSLIFKLLL